MDLREDEERKLIELVISVVIANVNSSDRNGSLITFHIPPHPTPPPRLFS